LLCCKSPKGPSDQNVIKTTLKNDTVDTKVEVYYPNSKQLKEVYYLKDGERYGEYICYFENGKIKSRGAEKHGLPLGKHTIYDSISGLKKMDTYYLILKDINKDSFYYWTNQIINYDENEKIIEEKSTYYVDLVTPDTIKNGETYVWGFKLNTPCCDSASILICDLDEYFILKPNEACEEGLIEDMQTAFSTKFYNLGENIIRGVIRSYDTKSDDPGHIIIYYQKEFYVLP